MFIHPIDGPIDRRSIQVRQSVSEAVRVWKRRQESAAETGAERIVSTPPETVLQSIPRRELSIPPDERKLWIPYVESPSTKIQMGKSLRRLLTWLRVILTVLLGNLLDVVLRKDTITRRAVRFREA